MKRKEELNEEGLRQVSGGCDPIGQFDIDKLLSGGGQFDINKLVSDGTKPGIEFELALDKETYPGTDYTVIRGNREDPIN